MPRIKVSYSQWVVSWQLKQLWWHLNALEKILNKPDEWSLEFLLYCVKQRRNTLKELLREQLKTFDKS